jgi:hypothetical protein
MQNNRAFWLTKYRSPLEIPYIRTVAFDVTFIETESYKAPSRSIYAQYNSTAFLD